MKIGRLTDMKSWKTIGTAMAVRIYEEASRAPCDVIEGLAERGNPAAQQELERRRRLDEATQ